MRSRRKRLSWMCEAASFFRLAKRPGFAEAASGNCSNFVRRCVPGRAPDLGQILASLPHKCECAAGQASAHAIPAEPVFEHQKNTDEISAPPVSLDFFAQPLHRLPEAASSLQGSRDLLGAIPANRRGRSHAAVRADLQSLQFTPDARSDVKQSDRQLASRTRSCFRCSSCVIGRAGPLASSSSLLKTGHFAGLGVVWSRSALKDQRVPP